MKKPAPSKLKSINDGLADDVELGHCIWIDECGWCMREVEAAPHKLAKTY